MWGGPWVIS